MIRVWGIVIGPLEAKSVKRSMIHAAFSAILDTEHWAGSKLWSIGNLESQSNEVAVLRVTTINNATAERLSKNLVPGSTLQFGPQEAFVLGPLQLWAEVSAKDIAAAEPVKALTVGFITPATFRSGKRSIPFAEPARVLHSLNNRWESLFGDASPGLRLAGAKGISPGKAWEAEVLRDSWISSLSGQTQQVRISKSLQVASFTGKVRYNFDSKLAAASFTPLWSLASLIGVGSYTTRGLGVIEVSEPVVS